MSQSTEDYFEKLLNVAMGEDDGNLEPLSFDVANSAQKIGNSKGDLETESLNAEGESDEAFFKDMDSVTTEADFSQMGDFAEAVGLSDDIEKQASSAEIPVDARNAVNEAEVFEDTVTAGMATAEDYSAMPDLQAESAGEENYAEKSTEESTEEIVEEVAEESAEEVAEESAEEIAEELSEESTEEIAEETEEETAPESEAAEDSSLSDSDDGDISDGDSLEQMDMLVDDADITNILNAIDEFSMDEDKKDDSVQEDSDNGEDHGDDLNVGGYDLANQDLGAMLADIENQSDDEGGQSGENADLADMLSEMGGDESEIGDLLKADENSEMVDPNSPTAEALFGGESEDSLFDIDSVLDDDQIPMTKEEKKADRERKKKAKKAEKALAKKKRRKKGADGEEQALDPADLDAILESEKKEGFFKRLFAKLTQEFDETDETDIADLLLDADATDIAAQGAAENENILNELADEKPAEAKKKKKKKEKKPKKEKAEKPPKPKKEKKVKEKKVKESEPEEPGKKIPRKQIIAVTLWAVSVFVIIYFVVIMLPSNAVMNNAKKYYADGDYEAAFELLKGREISEENEQMYDTVVMALRITRQKESYENYMKLNKRFEALNALIQGVKLYDTDVEEATTRGIGDRYAESMEFFENELGNIFGMSLDKAREFAAMRPGEEYTRALYDYLVNYKKEESEVIGESVDIVIEDNPIISAEEQDE